MRFHVASAFGLGVLIPALEACRAGLGQAQFDLPDYFAGALLLVAAWAAYRLRSWGSRFLLVAWAWVAALLFNSCYDQIAEGAHYHADSELDFAVLAIKILLLGISLFSLWRSFTALSSDSAEPQQMRRVV